jgi:ABC-type sugar transport system permease subunit
MKRQADIASSVRGQTGPPPTSSGGRDTGTQGSLSGPARADVRQAPRSRVPATSAQPSITWRRGLRGTLRSRSFDAKVLPWLLVIPAIVVMFLLVGYPVVRTIWLSFHSGVDLATGSFVGLSQYTSLFADPDFRAALLRTVLFSAVNVVATMIVALLVALILDAKGPRGRLLGAVVLLPWAMPRIASGIVWKWMFDAQYGTVNWLLTSIGLHHFNGYAWFNTGFSSLVVISAAWVWQSVPFVAIALLAGLRSNSPEIIEAARVDGARYWQVVLRVRLPMLRPLITVLLVMSTIWAFQAFDYFFVMTVPPGGPNHGTEVLSLLTWLNAFSLLQEGRAAAIAVITLVILTTVTFIYLRFMRDDVAVDE